MKISNEQWEHIRKYFPKDKERSGKGGRPAYKTREILQGVLWVLRVGARWKDLPRGYPSGATCHRHFTAWVRLGVFDKIIRALVEDLKSRGKIDLAETFIDATFVEAKKGAQKLEKPRVVKDLRSWPSSTVDLFLSPCLLNLLHHMRVNLLCQRFGPAILGTYLTELSETKLTILIHLGKLSEDIESNSLLPAKVIEKNHLKMGELYDATDEDGWSKDFFPGFNSFAE